MVYSWREPSRCLFVKPVNVCVCVMHRVDVIEGQFAVMFFYFITALFGPDMWDVEVCSWTKLFNKHCMYIWDFAYLFMFECMPSVLWHCWLGGRKGIRPVKNGRMDWGGHWLVRTEWRPAGWSVCLPLLIFPCTIKSRRFLAPADLGGPGKRAVKWLCVWCCGLNACKPDTTIYA